jgi:hypothetical protein
MLRGASDDRVRLHCALGGQESRTSVASSILFNTTRRRARAFGHKHAPIATRRPQHDEYATTAKWKTAYEFYHRMALMT